MLLEYLIQTISNPFSLSIILIVVLIIIVISQRQRYKKHIETLKQQLFTQSEHEESLVIEHKRETDRIIAKYTSEIEQIHERHSTELRLIKEQFYKHKENLYAMEEKQLLIELVCSSESFSDQIKDVVDLLKHDSSIKRIENSFTDFTQKLNKALNDLVNSEVHEKLDELKEILSNIGEQHSHIIDTLNELDDNVCDLDNSGILNGIEEIKGMLGDTYDYGTIAYNVNDIKSTIDDIKNNLE